MFVLNVILCISTDALTEAEALGNFELCHASNNVIQLRFQICQSVI